MPEPDVEPTQVLMAQQTFKGVPPEQAQGPDFQAAVQQGVEGQLGVPAGSVTITSTTEGENGAVIVMYVVQNVEPEDMDNMQKVPTLFDCCTNTLLILCTPSLILVHTSSFILNSFICWQHCLISYPIPPLLLSFFRHCLSC